MDDLITKVQNLYADNVTVKKPEDKDFVVVCFSKYRPDGDSLPIYIYRIDQGIIVSDLASTFCQLAINNLTTDHVGRRRDFVELAVEQNGARLNQGEIFKFFGNEEDALNSLQAFNNLLHHIANMFD